MAAPVQGDPRRRRLNDGRQQDRFTLGRGLGVERECEERYGNEK